MTKKKSFGVENPIIIGKPQEYDWHAWRVEFHGDVWLGFFRDDKAAIAWAQAQPFDVTVNNVPPPTSRHYITGGYTYGAFSQQPVKPRWKEDAGRVEAKGKRKTAAPAHKTTHAPFQTKGRERRTNQPFFPPSKPMETAEQRALREQAKQELSVIRDAETKDIADGKEEVH